MNTLETKQCIEYSVDRINKLNNKIKKLKPKAKAWDITVKKNYDTYIEILKKRCEERYVKELVKE